MNKINRKVEYALMALKHLAQNDPSVVTPAKEISEAYGAPFDAAARVLQILGQNGIVRSEQGAHGGYTLVRDLRQLSFLDLVSMVLGPLGIARCLHREDCELSSKCNIVTPVSVLNDRLTQFYGSLTVYELIFPEDEIPAAYMQGAS